MDFSEITCTAANITAYTNKLIDYRVSYTAQNNTIVFESNGTSNDIIVNLGFLLVSLVRRGSYELETSGKVVCKF